MNEHERGFLEFLTHPQRRRMATLLELGEKRRSDMRAMLDHAIRLDPERSERLVGSAQLAPAIVARLRREGAPDQARLMASEADLDGREMFLDDAVEALARSAGGGLVSCIPGRLGYFQYEDLGLAYLLKR